MDWLDFVAVTDVVVTYIIVIVANKISNAIIASAGKSSVELWFYLKNDWIRDRKGNQNIIVHAIFVCSI